MALEIISGFVKSFPKNCLVDLQFQLISSIINKMYHCVYSREGRTPVGRFFQSYLVVDYNR